MKQRRMGVGWIMQHRPWRKGRAPTQTEVWGSLTLTPPACRWTSQTLMVHLVISDMRLTRGWPLLLPPRSLEAFDCRHSNSNIRPACTPANAVPIPCISLAGSAWPRTCMAGVSVLCCQWRLGYSLSLPLNLLWQFDDSDAADLKINRSRKKKLRQSAVASLPDLMLVMPMAVGMMVMIATMRWSSRAHWLLRRCGWGARSLNANETQVQTDMKPGRKREIRKHIFALCQKTPT